MDAESAHPLLVAVELLLLAGGVGLLARVLLVPERRRKWFESSLLPAWPISGSEVGLLLLLMFLDGFLLQAVVQQFIGPHLGLARGGDLTGLQVFVYGLSFQVGTLLGWVIFGHLRRTWQPEVGAPPPPTAPANRLPPLRLLVAAGTTVLVALPLLAATALAWGALLRAAGLPDDPQDLIGIFARTESAVVFAGLLVVACVMAPIAEELIFRGIIFRFLRQRFGRLPALLVSAVLFGLLHANWAGFAPLCVLGVCFALAYEKTGDLRVAIAAHGLFNLLNVAIIAATGAQP